MTAFSVPVTLVSSSRMSAPCSPSCAHREVVVVELDLRAQRLQRQQVRVDAAPADAVAAGQRQIALAEAAQHRAGQQHGAADLLEQLRTQVG